MKDKKNGVLAQIFTGIAISIGGGIIKDTISLVKNSRASIINISEYDDTFKSLNNIIYKLNPTIYDKHRCPSSNIDFYELNSDVLYFVKLESKNYAKIESYNNDKTDHTEKLLKVSFFGNKKYEYRAQFLHDLSKITSKKYIRITYLNDRISCNIIPHCFNKIILKNEVKDRIINGLKNWNDSKSWYSEHELVHKIGVFLYGQPGTGKSTIVKGISNMFDNAPVLSMDQSDIAHSIRDIIKMRKTYSGTIIILIEDFDMYFKSRSDMDEDGDEDINNKADSMQNKNQNLLFQLLDGVYSTDNTIYVATTNYKDRIDPALIRYGRFDIQEGLNYFDYNTALQCIKMFGYDENMLDSLKLDYPVQPAYLQSKIMEYRSIEGRD